MADSNANPVGQNGSTVASGAKMVIPLLQNQSLGSPPKAEVDDASLQKTMDRNKESLKVKLMLRRPINQLVEQGIMPPLKTPPAFHEQRQKLERAKMGDFLKNKIQRRPDRQELIQQHILEDTTVDPSLHDKQRQLKKARLADDLNDRLSHRPGPLELIKGNILQTHETFAQAVREGQIQFKPTCEGENRKHPPPRFILEEDSGSDVALSPPQDSNDQSQSSLPSLETNEPSPAPMQGSPVSLGETKTTSMSSSASSIASPPRSMATPPTITSSPPPGHTQSIGKSRKKSKSKAQPKTRTIKFHEYKGPPSAQKNNAALAASSVESSYELLLQQQQLFLQWQLEWQQKYPQIILPATQEQWQQQPTQRTILMKPAGEQGSGGMTNHTSAIATQNQSHSRDSSSPPRTLSKLEDMKVSDLKAELKRRNLPVSGSKPQLIERLKPYSDVATSVTGSLVPSVVSDAASGMGNNSSSLPVNVGGILLDTLPAMAPRNEIEVPPLSPLLAMDTGMGAMTALSGGDVALGTYKGPASNPQAAASRPPSVVPMDVDTNSNSAVDNMDTVDPIIPVGSPGTPGDDIVKLQQKRIEELQMELQRSQLQLQQQQTIFHHQPQPTILPAGTTIAVPISQSQLQLQAQSSTDGTSVTTMATSTAPTPTCTIDTKLLQRQILQQHLQQKIQQQQMLQQHQQQQQQQQNGITPAGLIPSASASAAVKASLAAFLHSQQANSNTAAGSPTNTSSVATPSSAAGACTSTIASVQPVLVCSTTTIPTPVMTSPALPAIKSLGSALPNGLSHQRTPSLANFTAVNTKSSSSRSGADSQIIITKPPPDYNEATKHLNKAKKHFTDGMMNRLGAWSNQKSVKSQAVDDVLEILIKNGELPPSAAQEPTTPNTPGTPKSASTSIPVFPANPLVPPTSSTTPAVTSGPVTTVSSIPGSISSSVSSVHTNAISLPHPMAGDSLSPPPSAILEKSGTTSLDFDFHLDLEDIDAMDLGVLGSDGANSVSLTKPGQVPTLSSLPTPQMNHQTMVSLTPNQCLGSNQQVGLLNGEMTDLQDTGMNMDIELSDWLDYMIPLTPPASSVSALTPQPSFSGSVDQDPMLSTMVSSHDPFDLFSIEDMDFKTPTDLGSLTWDKVDFAT